MIGGGYARAWRDLPRPQQAMLGLLGLAVALANIDQPYPGIAPLQHVPTVLFVAAAPILLRKYALSDAALLRIVLFLLLHTLAGRYTYSNIPYDRWAVALSGVSIDQLFGFTRNNFDRLVHLTFGLTSVRPVREIASRHGGMSRRATAVMAFLFVGAVSALYEIFEWLLTIVLAPGMADDYNGQQGDVWDAQKDMAIAIAGSVIALISGCLRGLRRARS